MDEVRVVEFGHIGPVCLEEEGPFVGVVVDPRAAGYVPKAVTGKLPRTHGVLGREDPPGENGVKVDSGKRRQNLVRGGDGAVYSKGAGEQGNKGVRVLIVRTRRLFPSRATY